MSEVRAMYFMATIYSILGDGGTGDFVYALVDAGEVALA